MPCLACEDLSPTRGVQQLKLRLECALSSCGGRVRKEIPTQYETNQNYHSKR